MRLLFKVPQINCLLPWLHVTKQALSIHFREVQYGTPFWAPGFSYYSWHLLLFVAVPLFPLLCSHQRHHHHILQVRLSPAFQAVLHLDSHTDIFMTSILGMFFFDVIFKRVLVAELHFTHGTFDGTFVL